MRTRFRIFCLLFALVFFIGDGLSAFAAETPWGSAEHVQARLIGAGQKDGVLTAGLEVRLAPEWHSYWKAPGDAGLAPAFDWSGSVNAREPSVEWPAPERYETFGLYSFGYKDRVLFPLTAALEEPGRPATLALALDIMVCKDICVPQKISLSMEVPAGEPADAVRANVALIETARAKVPAKEDQPALKIETAVAGPKAFVVTAYAQHGFDEADVFVDAGDVVLSAPPEIELAAGDLRRATLRIKNPPGVEDLSAVLAGKTVSVTVVNRRRAVEKNFSF